MTDVPPYVSIDDGILTIALASGDGTRRHHFDGIADYTALGGLVGIEILDLRSQLRGGQPPAAYTGGFPRWSYDEEIDGFYVRLTGETSPSQVRVSGSAVLDESGTLLSLAIRVPR